MRRLPSEPVYLMNKRIRREGYKWINRRAKFAVIEICIIAVTLVVLFFSSNPFINNFKYRTNGISCEFQCPDFDNGNAMFFECGNDNFLVDSGNEKHGDELTDFLDANNIERINCLFIGDLNEEYIQSLDMIINSVSVDKIILPSTDDEQLQKIFDDYIASTPVISQTAIEGMSFRIGKSTLDVIDISSLSIKLSFGKNRFLILNSEYEPEDNISEFDAIIRNLDSVIEIEDISSEKIYRTDLNGDIIIKSNEVDIKIECEKQ